MEALFSCISVTSGPKPRNKVAFSYFPSRYSRSQLANKDKQYVNKTGKQEMQVAEKKIFLPLKSTLI